MALAEHLTLHLLQVGRFGPSSSFLPHSGRGQRSANALMQGPHNRWPIQDLLCTYLAWKIPAIRTQQSWYQVYTQALRRLFLGFTPSPLPILRISLEFTEQAAAGTPSTAAGHFGCFTPFNWAQGSGWAGRGGQWHPFLSPDRAEGSRAFLSSAWGG